MNFPFVKNYKNKLGIIFLVILGVTLFEPSATYAGFFDLPNISDVFLVINKMLIALVGNLLAWSVGIFSSVILIKDFADVTVVKTTWTIVRDFVNMFFILILVIIAFGTIFNSQKYSVTSPGLLGKFIVAALLINFSLVIGLLIINISQIFSNVFLTSIGDFGGNLGAGLNLNKIFTTGSGIQQLQGVSSTSVVVGTVIDSFFVIIIIVILFFSMLAATIFSLVRIPILWALLIVSPVVWALGILPFSQGLAQKWWKAFISWTFFLPSYLFMLLIGTVILKARTTPEFTSLFETQNSLATLAGFTLQDIFFYVLAVIILVGGLKASLSIGAFTSTGVSHVFGGIQGGIRGTGGLVARYTGISARGKALRDVAGRVKEEGVPRFRTPGWLGSRFGGQQIFKGDKEKREKTERFAEKYGRQFGFAPELKGQKQFLDTANKEFTSLQQRLRINDLEVEDIRALTNKHDADSATGFAARKLLADEGEIDGAAFLNATEKLADKNPFALHDLAKTSAGKDFSKIPLDDYLGMLKANPDGPYAAFRKSGAQPARREMALKLGSNKGALKKIDYGTFEASMDILRGRNTFEGKKLIKEISKLRPDITAEYIKEHPEPGAGPSPATPAGRIYKVIENMDPDALKDVLDSSWTDPDFQRALRFKISTLTRISRAQPALPSDPDQPGYDPKFPKGRNYVPSGGEKFKENLRKSVSHDRRKLSIVNSL